MCFHAGDDFLLVTLGQDAPFRLGRLLSRQRLSSLSICLIGKPRDRAR
jgi:hypothetical protein